MILILFIVFWDHECDFAASPRRGVRAKVRFIDGIERRKVVHRRHVQVDQHHVRQRPALGVQLAWKQDKAPPTCATVVDFHLASNGETRAYNNLDSFLGLTSIFGKHCYAQQK